MRYPPETKPLYNVDCTKRMRTSLNSDAPGSRVVISLDKRRVFLGVKNDQKTISDFRGESDPIFLATD